MMHQLGLDLPLHEQYFHYIAKVLQGDFGASFRTQQPILTEFLHFSLLQLNWHFLRYFGRY